MSNWFYKCDICGRTFPIWWVSAEEWEKSGFDGEICKACFEQRVPHPRYYSVDEYIEAVTDYDEMAEEILKNNPDFTPEMAKRRAVDLKCEMYEELEKIWDS